MRSLSAHFYFWEPQKYMDIKDVANSGQKIIIFAVQVLILFICIWFIEYIYYGNIYPDKLVKETYEQTNCQIDSKSLEKAGKTIYRFRADFLVTYMAQGCALSAINLRQWVGSFFYYRQNVPR